ncbi:MAG: prolipoprotein diacylglyceryl transferase [Clostridia bacterium]|nr:prolipoprotein diacylglyceryl transferase [Clostridia bacterium]
MKFFQDAVDVYFKAFGDKAFSVSSVFCEFSVGGRDFSIKWYGVIIAFGFLLAVLFGGRIAYKWRISLDKMIDVLIYGTILGIIGARLYYVIFAWDSYKDHPLDALKIWEGGLAIYGGIIGGILGAYITCRVRKLNFWNLLDMVGMSLLIGQGIGRWGNFANQEAFGTNTDLPWGMYSEKTASALYAESSALAARGIDVDPTGYVHPTFLYESLWCLLGFVVLYIIMKKFRKFSGQLFLCYGMWYGFERMVVEGLRTDSLYVGGTNIRISQVLSALLVFACLAIFFVKMIKYTKDPKPIEGVDYFPADAAKTFKEKKEAKMRALAEKNEVKTQTEETAGQTEGTVEQVEQKEIPDVQTEEPAGQTETTETQPEFPSAAADNGDASQ